MLINVGNIKRKRKASQIESFLRDLQRKIGLRINDLKTLDQYKTAIIDICKNYNKNWTSSETNSTPEAYITGNFKYMKPWEFR